MESLNQGRVVSANFLLQHIGIYDVLGTKELILRDEQIESLDASCAKDLASLELLSLSHNLLTSLQHFEHFHSLIELNINFNQVTTLEPLQCFSLQKLYAANNKITSIESLRSFPKLVHVSVFGNDIVDLDLTLHTCRKLLKLRSLDLDGNPCSRVKGYKYETLQQLARLEELDGEKIQPLDREMLLEQPLPSARQTNAPPAAPCIQFGNATAWSPSDELRGPVALFRDPFLNNNPILLEYLAQSASPRQDVEEVQAEKLSKSSSFVDKMHLANPDPVDAALLDTGNGVTTPRCPMAAPCPQSTHSIVDPSDPKSTIRKLLKHIEQLTASAEAYKAAASDAAVDKLLEEIQHLRIENNNIPILQEEIQTLNKQLRHVPEAPLASSLQAENAALKREIKKLRTIIEAQKADTPMTKEEILDQAATVDVELTALIMQNEISLEVMRQTIKKTKLEMQNERVARLTGHTRPNTSAGDRQNLKPTLLPASPQRRRLHTSAGRSNAPSTSLNKKSFKKRISTVREEEDEMDNNNSHGPEIADVLVL